MALLPLFPPLSLAALLTFLFSPSFSFSNDYAAHYGRHSSLTSTLMAHTQLAPSAIQVIASGVDLLASSSIYQDLRHLHVTIASGDQDAQGRFQNFSYPNMAALLVIQPHVSLNCPNALAQFSKNTLTF
ncbi:hypothetical protein DFH07DRAFT_775948 [Mycena maculata]|uniref:Uncharacterized protein n=1 Tax=Mycena maculata TaxID=230809 RepID=A0AAD7IP99_9AGAR|nr:hypothetical protein DFH07DRAFT_775948 [Mycena maculata]